MNKISEIYLIAISFLLLMSANSCYTVLRPEEEPPKIEEPYNPIFLTEQEESKIQPILLQCLQAFERKLVQKVRMNDAFRTFKNDSIMMAGNNTVLLQFTVGSDSIRVVKILRCSESNIIGYASVDRKVIISCFVSPKNIRDLAKYPTVEMIKNIVIKHSPIFIN